MALHPAAPAGPAASAPALDAQSEPARRDPAEHPPEFPGCRPVRITRAALDDYEGRFEYWDGDTETAWVVREPVTVYHEGPGQRLAALLTRMAAVRGAPIATLGTADLALRDARGERRRIMQADQMVYLDPAGTQPPGPWVEVGTDHLPDVVLEVDYSTDVRRGTWKRGGVQAMHDRDRVLTGAAQSAAGGAMAWASTRPGRSCTSTRHVRTSSRNAPKARSPSTCLSRLALSACSMARPRRRRVGVPVPFSRPPGRRRGRGRAGRPPSRTR